MPALATVVSDYLTSVKNSLSVGKDLGSNVDGPPVNYLKALDMASVLELLQDALDAAGPLTAVSGDATSVTDGASTFEAGTQVGNVVTFTGNVTASLAGVEAVVISNDTTTLNFASGALPEAPDTGDTYSIRAAFLDKYIEDLREGKGLADSPAGSVYGEHRVVLDALCRLIRQLGGTVPDVSLSHASLEVGSGSSESAVVLSEEMRIDQHKGAVLTISGESRKIVNNTEFVANVAPAFSSAPSASTAASISAGRDRSDSRISRVTAHPGAQPGENSFLSLLIDSAQTLVVAFTTPS